MIDGVRSDVLIIGAGAAGLAAARDLSIAGKKVVILEARDRIGGRIFTRKHRQQPAPIELGAEFVHGKSPALLQFAQRVHLGLQAVTERHWYLEHGRLQASGDFWAKIEKLNEKMQLAGTDQSLKDFLGSLPDNEDMRLTKGIATAFVEGFHAASIDRIGIRGLVEAAKGADSVQGDQAFRFREGYSALVQALRTEVEARDARIVLSAVVREIRWNDDGVEVFCEGESGDVQFTASCAAITLPLGVLQTAPEELGGVRFVPALPAEKQRAISNLQMGHALRIALSFREPFWEKLRTRDQNDNLVSFADVAFIHGLDLQIATWWTQLPSHAPLLVGWVGGPAAERIVQEGASAGKVNLNRSSQEAAEDLLESFIVDRAITSLAQIFGLSGDDILDWLEASYFHDWRNDPFTRGAYAYVPVNGLEAQQALSEPLNGTLFFAGEATTKGHIGTVHGAIMSGERIAKEILVSDKL